MTPLKPVLDGLGLTTSEAAQLLDVRLDTMKSWSSGRNGAPAGVLAQLHGIARRQEQAADAIVDGYNDAVQRVGSTPEGLDLTYDPLAWTPGQWRAVVRRAWERLPDAVRISYEDDP